MRHRNSRSEDLCRGVASAVYEPVGSTRSPPHSLQPSLQESARKIALERFRIIQPYLEQDRSLSVIARKARIPYRTIHRWLTRYRWFGLAALARKAREDRGKRRALSLQLLDDGDGVL